MDTLNNNLEDWRRLLKRRPESDWNNENKNHKSKNVNEARMRGKYYGAKYIIHRPALEYILKDAIKPRVSPLQQQNAAYTASSDQHTPRSTQSSPDLTDTRLWDAAKTCIEAAKRSTTVFDDVPTPLILTNIYGTAQAQFGNVLVLMATYRSGTSLARLLDRETMSALLDRTIRFLKDHRGCCPGMDRDVLLLEKLKECHFSNEQSVFGRARWR